MKHIHIKQPGSADVLQVREGAQPVAKAGEVLIRIAAAGVNRPDIFQRKGSYPPPPGASPILGLEVAGVIEAIGEPAESVASSGAAAISNAGAAKTNWKVGDRVCALVPGGGYAEYCVTPAVLCLPIPAGLSMEEAAALPETFFTVWANVFMRGHLVAGENILIHGGSSGIGTTAIQLAREFGAHVFVTAGSEEKCDFCVKLGARGAVNYKRQDFVTEIRRMNAGVGMDLILDMVAGEYFPKNLELLAQEGRLVYISTQKGEQVNLSLRTVMAKCATITGSMLRPRTVAQKAAIANQLREKVWPLLESKKVRVILDEVFPFDRVADAHRHMESSEHIGKIVLKVADL
jgi:NADPH2:quinone reductase